MSQRGVVRPLHLERENARAVGDLIETRVDKRLNLDAAADPLCLLGRKLRKASRRRRASGALLAIWSVTRAEATDGFHYLALFTLPAAEGYLSARDDRAVRAVILELAVATPQRELPTGLGLVAAILDAGLMVADTIPADGPAGAHGERRVVALKRAGNL